MTGLFMSVILNRSSTIFAYSLFLNSPSHRSDLHDARCSLVIFLFTGNKNFIDLLVPLRRRSKFPIIFYSIMYKVIVPDGRLEKKKYRREVIEAGWARNF